MYKLLNPDDMPTPELRELVRKTNEMARGVYTGTIRIKIHKQGFYPWRPQVFKGN